MQKTKHWLVSLLLILFTGYYGGITLFPHVHELDGQRIVHSHPYSGTPSHSGHHHSAQQIQLLHLLTLLTWLGAASCWLTAPLRGYRRIAYGLILVCIGSRHSRSRLLRGPPVLE